MCGVAVDANVDIDRVEKFIEHCKAENDEVLYGINADGSEAESCKWYKHEHDMRELSSKFPSILFTLHGEGEEPGDIWNKYFLGGQMQVAKGVITFEKLDPAKLK